MHNFTYFTPTKVVFGRRTEEKAGSLIKERGCRKVLLHYGGGSVIRSGLLERVKASLDAAQIAYVELGGVVPNPRLSLVRQGIELARREEVDFILAVGGGSVIDSAKAIGFGLANEIDVWELYLHKVKVNACLPVGVILTIAAAGSEMSDSSVITNEDGWLKLGYGNNVCRPAFAIMNPELTLSLPAYQTACGCTDILMHTMERYFTSGGNMELTDNIAEALMRTVIANTKTVLDQPDDYDARAEIMWAGSLSHNGLTGCGNDGGDFATHLLEHELSAVYDIAHGAGLAALWGSWARYVYQDCLPRFRRFALQVMGVAEEGSDAQIALAGIEAMEDFYRAIGMPTCLRDLDLTPTEEQLALMARKCGLAAGGRKGSAKVLVEKDMLAIYQMAR